MRDIRIFHSPDNVMFTFIEKHKGEDRLVIGAHGDYSFFKKTKICTESGPVNAFRLAVKLKSAIDFESIRYIKLVICGGANKYSNSFAADLSKHFHNVRIKGYIDLVNANFSPDVIKKIIYLSCYHESFVKKLMLSLGHLRVEKSSGYNYHSVTFLNGQVIKQSNVNNNLLRELSHRIRSFM